MDSQDHSITQLLEAVRSGQTGAEERLLTMVYDELRRMARVKMSRFPAGDSLQSAGIVHEAWLRVQDAAGPTIENRRHFFFAAARAMRDVLVEEARRKAALKRGGAHRQIEADVAQSAGEFTPEDLIDLATAVDSLHEDERRLVELRFFAGLTIPETAEILGLAPRSVDREWKLVRAKLFRMLNPPGAP